jgi:hypothetical protein
MVNPTIGLEIGETYTFVQTDRSNYMHPMGFAYYPNGNHHDGLKPAATATSMQMMMPKASATATSMPMQTEMEISTEAMPMQTEVQSAAEAMSMQSCVSGATCPAPMYFSDDKYLGVYSNYWRRRFWYSWVRATLFPFSGRLGRHGPV